LFAQSMENGKVGPFLSAMTLTCLFEIEI